MLELGTENARVVTLVGDISHGILQPFAEQFPDRYYNVGICEPTIVGLAAGLSHVGMVPFVHTIAPFLVERAYEQIKLDFGYQKLSGNLVSVGGSFDYSQLGCSHHTYMDVAMVAQIEDSEVYMPGSSQELTSLMRATYDRGGLKYFRLTENPHGIDLADKVIAPGKGILVRDGTDITVVATGPQLKTAVQVAEKLDGMVSVEILYFPTFKPFDGNLVRQSARKTGALVSIEELGQSGGIYHAALSALVGTPVYAARQLSVGGFVRGYGSYDDLCNTAGIGPADLESAIIECEREKSSSNWKSRG